MYLKSLCEVISEKSSTMDRGKKQFTRELTGLRSEGIWKNPETFRRKSGNSCFKKSEQVIMDQAAECQQGWQMLQKLQMFCY